jgi:hypothetical protein
VDAQKWSVNIGIQLTVGCTHPIINTIQTEEEPHVLEKGALDEVQRF